MGLKVNRYLYNQVKTDLYKKMVFIGGPRQIGKTTMAESLVEEFNGCYLNWDIATHRTQIIEDHLPDSKGKMWCFDELHRFSQWRNFLKGLFDQYKKTHKILVTGSARLDYYRYSGDSLQGRYHYLRLHPLSVAELGLKNKNELDDLLRFGGFPEPYFSGSQVDANRWASEYHKRLIDEEVRSLEQVKDFSSLDILARTLPKKVGSLLSINGLKEDLKVSHKTLTHWVEILERLFHIFRIYPFGSDLLHAVQKSSKHYHWNWGFIPNDAARFENFIASHLLKWVQFQQDTLGENIELRYFRDTDQREVDFIIVKDDLPIMAVECKISSEKISPHLIYFKKKFPECKAYQVCLEEIKIYSTSQGIYATHALEFLSRLI